MVLAWIRYAWTLYLPQGYWKLEKMYTIKKKKTTVICRNARKRCHMTRNIVYCMPMKMIDCVHTCKRGRGLVSRYHRNFHMNPQFKQEILTAQNKLNQVCCNCMDLFCLFLVQHPPKKISSIRSGSGVGQKLMLNCHVNLYFLCFVKTCEDQPLKKLILKKNVISFARKNPEKLYIKYTQILKYNYELKWYLLM